MRVTNFYEIYLFTASYIVSWNHNALSHWPIGVIGVFIIQLHKVEYNNARIEYKYLSILYLFYKGIFLQYTLPAQPSWKKQQRFGRKSSKLDWLGKGNKKILNYANGDGIQRLFLSNGDRIFDILRLYSHHLTCGQHMGFFFFSKGTVTNSAIWLVLYAVRIFLSVPTGNGNAFVSRRVHPYFRCHFS